jgi:hypothetical protein
VATGPDVDGGVVHDVAVEVGVLAADHPRVGAGLDDQHGFAPRDREVLQATAASCRDRAEGSRLEPTDG